MQTLGTVNLLQMALGIVQQVALVPGFLHYSSNDVLAAWLAISAVGNLGLIADAGLQARAINRFLQFKSAADGDGRAARFYGAMLRIYLGIALTFTFPPFAGAACLAPSAVFGFVAVRTSMRL